MQKKTIFFAIAICCLTIIVISGVYWYQKPRESITEMKPAYTVSAKELYEAFQMDEGKANKQYLEKIILVSGTVNSVQATDTTINLLLSSGNEVGGINCIISKKPGNNVKLPEKGAITEVKGRCIGYLMDVNLIDAVIEN